MNVKQLQDKDGTDFQPNVPDKVGYFKSGSTALAWDTTNTASEDGWVSCISKVTSADTDMKLEIHGTIVSSLMNTASSGYIKVKFFTPVKKGDTIKASGGNTSLQELMFFSNRTALSGGGEFDPISISSTPYTRASPVCSLREQGVV